MKATWKLAAVCLAGTVSLLVIAEAPAAGFSSAFCLSAAVIGQATADQPEERDPVVLLREARQAMERKQWDDADAYLRRAERLWGWGAFRNPLGDTPKKVRRDLEKMQAAGEPVLPSQQARPTTTSPWDMFHRPEPTDPFHGRGPEVDAIMTDKKPLATSYLRQGREELARGNVSAAAYNAQLAADTGVQFGPNEDSPERLAQDARRQGAEVVLNRGDVTPPGAMAADGEPQHVPSLSTETGAAAANNSDIRALPMRDERSAAGSGKVADGGAVLSSDNKKLNDQLLLDARRAISVGDTRRALTLTAQARGLNIAYGPSEDSPTKIETLARRYNEVMQRRGEPGSSDAFNRLYAQLLLEQAESLLAWHDYENAERLANDADQLRVEYAPYESTPTTTLQRIAAQRRAAGPGDATRQLAAVPSGGGYDAQPAVYDPHRGDAADPRGGVGRAVYDPNRDDTRNLPAGADGPERPPVTLAPQAQQLPPPLEPSPSSASGGGPPPARLTTDAEPIDRQSAHVAELIRMGDEALAHRDTKTARQFYLQGAAERGALDPTIARRLQNRLQLVPSAVRADEGGQLLGEASDNQQRLKTQVAADVAKQVRQAMDMREHDPVGALNQLRKARNLVEQSSLTPDDKRRHFIRIDRQLAETEHYIEQHRSEIDLRDHNRAVTNDVEARRAHTIQVQERLAMLVDEYNKLLDDRRYSEAEVKAKQAHEIAPEERVTIQMLRESSLLRHINSNRELRDEKNEGVWAALDSAEHSAIPQDDRIPYMFAKDWQDISTRRGRYGREADRKRSPKELEIEQKLRTPVSLKFREAPLSEVMDYLKRVTGVNIYMDPQGMAQEGIHPSQAVTIDLSQDISLRSALNLILQPMHLGYVITDEVLKITSEQYKSGNLYTKVYNVADLVIPIPNFPTTNEMGLTRALAEGYSMTSANLSGGGGGFQPPAPGLLAHAGTRGGHGTPNGVLANESSAGASMGAVSGHVRGGDATNFDPLIELISHTIDPSSWSELGGPGTIQSSEGNLSLVISQIQENHEKIADLLEQLRRLQDLQVTIEVRFIQLEDDFFERIGINFDFNVRDNATSATVTQATASTITQTGPVVSPSATIGLTGLTNGVPAYQANGGIPFVSDVLAAAAVPPFPLNNGFNTAQQATFGFAILSDIEAYFLIQAVEADTRTNVMQAPKVTLFNGQTASIADQTQTPFVTSVTPIVGDFAAAQAPVIVVLSEGTTLSVQAVVSQDRRFVRLTLVPFFSQIGSVKEFTFTGSTTTNTSSAATSANSGDTTSNNNGAQVVASGTTVQQPVFHYTTVTTTVSVPDGGTVLLGGLKLLSEGRKEYGVPMLSQLPYINRLFKNVGIGRSVSSLMLMVTPRIIIQEEEEDKLGLAPNKTGP